MAQYYRNRISELAFGCHIHIHVSKLSEYQIRQSIHYLRDVRLCDYEDEVEWDIIVGIARLSGHDEPLEQLRIYKYSPDLEINLHDETDESPGETIIPYGTSYQKIILLPYDIDIILDILEENGDISEYNSDSDDEDDDLPLTASAA